MTDFVVSASLESEDFPTEDTFVTRFHLVEALSSPFSLDLDLAVPDATDLAPADLLGSRVTLRVGREGASAWPFTGTSEPRAVHGVVVGVRQLLTDDTPAIAEVGGGAHAGTLRLTVAPRIQRLTLVETQEVYLEMNVPEILREKLTRAGLTEGEDFSLSLTGTYPKRDFVVQYRETDLAFLSRLCEHVGIGYRIEHESGRDKVVFSDHNSAFAGAEPLERRFRADGPDAIRTLERTTRVVPALYAIQDYNYRTPLSDVFGQHELQDGFGGGIVEYGAHTKTADQANSLAQIRAEERLNGRDVVDATSDFPDLRAGSRLTIKEHRTFDAQLELLVTSVEHTFTVTAFAGGSSHKPEYRNTFCAIPANVTYRPARRTPRPRIFGFVTGLVEPVPDAPGAPLLAPSMDEEGRYWVRFHFDTAAPGTKKASRPIRMAQQHAGAGYGTHFPLRPGVEVLLAFHDGDPDRPIIVGAVPNGINPSPVTSVNPQHSEVLSASGILIQFRDAIRP
jgi:type VI secretion system secreted protein VgrG